MTLSLDDLYSDYDFQIMYVCDLNLYSKSSLTLKEWKFNLSFP
jgi:hypothetical protein